MSEPTRESWSAVLMMLGASGLAASGLGLLPGAPGWVWLAVLLAGAFLPYLRERAADAKERTDDLRTAREALDSAGVLFRMRLDEWGRRLEGVITPEESRRLRADFNAMVLDMQKLSAQVETVAKEQRVREMGENFLGEVP